MEEGEGCTFWLKNGCVTCDGNDRALTVACDDRKIRISRDGDFRHQCEIGCRASTNDSCTWPAFIRSKKRFPTLPIACEMSVACFVGHLLHICGDGIYNELLARFERNARSTSTSWVPCCVFMLRSEVADYRAVCRDQNGIGKYSMRYICLRKGEVSSLK